MKIMRWRKKKNSDRCKRYKKYRRSIIVVAVFLVVTAIVALVNSQIASADADSDLKTEVYNYKTAQKIKACERFFKAFDETHLSMKDISTKITGVSPYDEGVRGVPGHFEDRDRIKCDVFSLAEQNGHGDYFVKYFKDHAKLDDDPQKSDIFMSDNSYTASDNHKAQRVMDLLNSNSFGSLKIKGKLYAEAVDGYPVPNISDAALAQLYWEAIVRYCASNKSNPFNEAGDGEYQYKSQGEDGKYTVKHGYFSFEDKNRAISVWPGIDTNTGQADMSCEEAVKKYSDLAQKHVDALNQHIDSNPDDSKDTKNPAEEEDDCAAELNGFGSIICSGQNLFATITDILYGTIAKMLVDQTELTKSDTVRKHWGNFLTIANIILIIAFLVVIYSTATSTGGLSNYDVKKLLPRIIIFAIAINLSFYICMALVDLSTIVGKGIFGLLMGGSTGAPPQLINSAQKTAGVLESAGIVVALVAIAAVLVILVGAPIILALLAIVFALVVRGIALMILVIISPVAIALYLFNNQGLSKGFTMWRDNYIKLLLVYPLFMLVWGGTRVVSGLVNQGDQDGINALFVLLVETICLITPALSIMPLFKASGDIMGKATLMAATNGATNKFAGWAGSKLTGKPGDPKHPGLKGMAAGAIGGAAGNIAGRAAGAVQNMRGAGASTGNIATQLDSQAMNSARNKVNKYGDRDLKTAFTTGQIGGKTLDPYQMRAVIEKELPNASAAEIKQSMQAVNTEADKLRKNGQAADADRLVQTFANTASANGNSIMSGKSLRNFATSGGWNTSQFEANYADAVADYSSTQLTAKDAAGMDAADLIQMRTTLQNAGVNGGNIAQADAGLSSMAKQSNIALSDPKLTRKMNAPTVTALKDNTMVRSTAGERLANTHKIPNIYHDYNTGGTTSAQAISDARTMMAHTDFGRLDAIDQSRLRAIARASAPAGTGAPAAPVVIASWDSRVP